MNGIPDWALTLAFWMHMLGTVLWLGGLTSVYLFFNPNRLNTAQRDGLAAWFDRTQQGLLNLGWFSALLLLGTGMFQMSANPNYEGLLAINNRWAVAMLLKHITFLVMLVVSGYHTWGLMPALNRARFRQSKGLTGNNLDRLHRRENLILRLNLLLALAVLGLTALARVS